MVRKLLFGALAATLLVSCAKAPAGLERGATELAAAGLDGPGLNEGPRESFVVPDRPLRAPAPWCTGNSAKLHDTPAETLPALKALIMGAKRSIWFETFNFGNDSMGKQIYPLLIERAKAGVQVKVIADWVGSRFIPKHAEMARALRAAGVDLKLYKPRWIVKDDQRKGINIDHRKVYMADGERALVGGVNLMADFDTRDQDVLVEWRGPIVADLAKEYAYDWKLAGGAPLALPQAAPPARAGDVRARVVVTSPSEGRFEGRDAIYAALDAAVREIRIVNQYLWDDKLIARLHAALKRGIKVRVVVPGEEDNGIFKAIHAEELRRLVDAGAEARVFTGIDAEAHLHTKYFGVDETWVAIGSTNGDTRALLDNQELDTIIEDARLAAEFRDRMFARDWTVWSKPFVYKPGGPMTKPFRTLLEIIDYYL